MPALRPKNIDPSQTEPEVKYFYNVDEKMIIFCTFCSVKVLYLETGLGRDHFLEARRRKVVAEKLLLGRFSIGWTFCMMPTT